MAKCATFTGSGNNQMTLDDLIQDRFSMLSLQKLLTEEHKRRWDLEDVKLSAYVPWSQEMQDQIQELVFNKTYTE